MRLTTGGVVVGVAEWQRVRMKIGEEEEEEEKLSGVCAELH